jgi:hypothetical protein
MVSSDAMGEKAACAGKGSGFAGAKQTAVKVACSQHRCRLCRAPMHTRQQQQDLHLLLPAAAAPR